MRKHLLLENVKVSNIIVHHKNMVQYRNKMIQHVGATIVNNPNSIALSLHGYLVGFPS